MSQARPATGLGIGEPSIEYGVVVVGAARAEAGKAIVWLNDGKAVSAAEGM